MSKNVKILFFSLFAGLFFVSVSLAETIVLKSGKTVEGKITNRTNEYTEVDFMGVKLKYFNDQIEKINETKTATNSTDPAQEKELISIKIKGSGADSSNKVDDIVDFIKRLDGINNKIDSIVNERMSKALDPKAVKMTDQQYESIKSVISATKERITEVEKMKTPTSCKLLKEIFLKKCKARISGLDELLEKSLPPGEATKIVERQNKEISEISKKYSLEQQRIIKEYGVKL
ncbi:MAG: hypothetical protein M0R20_02235 [Candidatus Omnitrophica bacterium]|jgi:hypothetical protein|nr:hypothetical protein [Candidatus Omnitrophota bacterium]